MLHLTTKVLDLDLAFVKGRIKKFIKGYVEQCSAKGVVLGMSGGLDSSTTAALAALSLGGRNVLGIAMPEEETYNPVDIKHVNLLKKKFGFDLEVIDISSTLRACFESIPIYDQADKLCRGNMKARIRMIYLYYYANKLKRLVCGTSDKSETLMGYFTKYGDAAADISPIMGLYKTQVKKLASHIGVPAEITTKPPSPGLWPGQLAEEELGISYETLDLILFGLEHFMTPQEIAEQLKLSAKIITETKRRWMATEHKRRLPWTLKL